MENNSTENKTEDKKTIKGMEWLLQSMIHHYTRGLRTFIRAADKTTEDGRRAYQEAMDRTKGLEKDILSLLDSFRRIEGLAKAGNYEEIIRIINEEEYINGFEVRHELQ